MWKSNKNNRNHGDIRLSDTCHQELQNNCVTTTDDHNKTGNVDNDTANDNDDHGVNSNMAGADGSSR